MINVTLPITLSDYFALDSVQARDIGEKLAETYRVAEPFPHIVIDEFLPAAIADRILCEFPAAAGNDKVFNEGYQGLRKRQICPEDCSGFARGLFAFFNSTPVLQFLESLTGIKGLISDPYFDGGGFHEISTGGRLGIHADFRIHKRLNIQRRLNLLLYLNKNWRPEWGGELELWDRAMTTKVRGVQPIFNRCVVFSTDRDSFHGHPDPLLCPDNVTRKSIALYYYTASERIHEDIPDTSTFYKARPDDDASVIAEARRLRRSEHLKDWMPPVLLRAIRARRR